MASILFIYGSTGGNTELVVEKVADVLASDGHKTTLQRAELSDPKKIKDYDFCVLASSTYAHGKLQYHMKAFAHKLSSLSLEGTSCAVIGLGDDKYDSYYHMEAAKILEDLVKDLGGTLAIDALRITKSPVPELNGSISKWAKRLAKKI